MPTGVPEDPSLQLSILNPSYEALRERIYLTQATPGMWSSAQQARMHATEGWVCCASCRSPSLPKRGSTADASSCSPCGQRTAANGSCHSVLWLNLSRHAPLSSFNCGPYRCAPVLLHILHAHISRMLRTPQTLVRGTVHVRKK